MKSLSYLLALTLTITNYGFASVVDGPSALNEPKDNSVGEPSDPSQEPKIEKNTFEVDSVEISRILLNIQLSSCVAEFQDSNAVVTYVGGHTLGNDPAGTTHYTLVGNILQIDAVVGRVTLEITEITMPSPFGFSRSYSCDVEITPMLPDFEKPKLP